jgi:hypothetical protein
MHIRLQALAERSEIEQPLHEAELVESHSTEPSHELDERFL